MRPWVKALVGVGLVAGSNATVLADVLNMGGSRDPITWRWNDQASLEFVPVGDAGNAADATGYGAVSYSYQMGKYEVTTSQYCQFLNAVAATDTYGLYRPYMSYMTSTFRGCGIVRSGEDGSYAYSVLTGNENLPVNWVSWGDAARFCNWLANGQPTGAQGSGTTETGSYTLNGAIGWMLRDVPRNPGATYVIPSEDEWYKAAYYKGGGVNAGYWMYPTQSDDDPSHYMSITSANSANFYGDPYTGEMSYTDPSNYMTWVGLFAKTTSPCGAYDMGGNVYEWTDGLGANYDQRVMRGGSYATTWIELLSHVRKFEFVDSTYNTDGFRIALVPEPATVLLLAAGCLLKVRRRSTRSAAGR